MPQKAQRLARCLRCILRLTSFLAVPLNVWLRGGGWRIVAVGHCARPPERPARKAPECPPLSSQLVYKTSSVRTAQEADRPARGAKKHRLRSQATSRPRAPESATTGFQDLCASRRN